jgi:two-component system sensor histidine kinase/response regulator
MKGVIKAILENAIRFSPLGGCVTVSVWSDNKHCYTTISDKGVGIEPDFLSRVFEEFAVADIIHHSEGQGLSLAIARQVVLAHNGTIEVKSTKGAGTTFTVRLPIVVSGE